MRLALPTPPTGTHRTRVRAGLLLLRAAVHSTAGSLLPSPPAACSHALAAHSRGPCRAPTNNLVGGWEKMNESWRGRP